MASHKKPKQGIPASGLFGRKNAIVPINPDRPRPTTSPHIFGDSKNRVA